ncbi:MAG TPA: hypothetical protein VJ577_01640 [Burkholderiaceae bacterium]|nr:hypothetical protein [Burkholderiaceae bacterium]
MSHTHVYGEQFERKEINHSIDVRLITGQQGMGLYSERIDKKKYWRSFILLLTGR